MIIVTTFLNENKNIVGFEIKGHANSNSKQKEIICASVSSLSQTIVLSLITFLKIECDYEINKGYLYLYINNYNNLNNNIISHIDTLLNTLLLGLKNIDRNYNNNIDFKVRLLRDKSI